MGRLDTKDRGAHWPADRKARMRPRNWWRKNRKRRKVQEKSRRRNRQ